VASTEAVLRWRDSLSGDNGEFSYGCGTVTGLLVLVGF